MTSYGIIGYPLKTTFSPAYFAEKFQREGIDNTSYTAFPMEDVSGFATWLAQRADLRGINVTIPHKTAIIPHLTSLSDAAKAIGAVNCVRVHEDGTTIGYNTDWKGFRDSLQPLLKARHTSALVLGTGGASLAIQYALEQMGIAFKTVSRDGSKGSLTYWDLSRELMAQYPLLINTTPLGMGSNAGTYPPLPYEALTPDHLLYDVVYEPALTRFLALGQERGAVIKNGLEMLHRQAEASWDIWNS